MFTSSEDAMTANCAISFAAAKRELRNHGMDCNQVSGGMIVAFNPLDTADCARIPCTTKAILEWLGY